MAVCKQLFSLISLISLALVFASFQTSANALSLESHNHHARNIHQHDLLAKKKRSTNQKRCKSRPTPSSAPAPAPPKSSAAAAAPSPPPSPAAHSSSSPPPPPKPTSSAPPPPKSTPSSSSSGHSIASIFPKKALLAWGGNGQQLSQWTAMDHYYNWGVNPTAPSGSPAPPFIPMLWSNKNQGSWVSNVLNAKPPPLIAFTYNEPELDGQGTTDPQDAATFFDNFIAPLVEKGTLIGSPAVTSDSNGGPWLDSFFGACNNGHAFCGCAFLDLHWYGTDPQDLITFLESMHSKYGLDIVLSEFACQDFTSANKQCSPGDVQNMANTMVSFFESTSWIAAYAPFGALPNLGNVNPDNSLMNGNGGPNSLALTYFPHL